VSWKDQAACLAADPEAFFPASSSAEAAEEAKKWCRICPVWQPCRDEALATAAEGVWGGLSERERRAILRKRGVRLSKNTVPEKVRIAALSEVR
jgi:WhiB family redox-sensing transcriptional regulator